MLSLYEQNKQTHYKHYDYLPETLEEFYSIVNVLTPKFEGSWEFVFINMKISETKALLDDSQLPDFINCTIYLPLNKLNKVLEEYPKYKPVILKPYEQYMQFLSTLTHPVDKKAVSYIYQASQRNLDTIKEVMQKIDEDCTGDTITIRDVQKEFSYTKHVYTSQVLKDLLQRNKSFSRNFEIWVNELGTEYAYNSMFKQVKQLLLDKQQYLLGKEVHNPNAVHIDGISITRLYLLFMNSTHHKQLDSIAYIYYSNDLNMFKEFTYASI